MRSLSMPGPLSCTVITQVLSLVSVIATVPPAGVKVTALPITWARMCSMHSPWVRARTPVARSVWISRRLAVAVSARPSTTLAISGLMSVVSSVRSAPSDISRE